MRSLIYIIALFSCLLLSNCEEGEEKNFLVEVKPEKPIVINAGFTLRINAGGDEPLEIEIKGPWALSFFDFKNDTDETVVIINLSFHVTGPDGVTRIQSVENLDAQGETLPFYSIVRSTKDVDCDGVVEEDEDEAVSAEDCDLDRANSSVQNTAVYISDMLKGLKEEQIEDFRGSSYEIEARFEGWFGTFDKPTSNFLKSYFFTAAGS